ncbi:MAG: class I SAM-dependent methyltransferase [Anaerolineales bacterium]|nr:class I SAM-dependent methyltransferase [Anaerolineales bacterium]
MKKALSEVILCDHCGEKLAMLGEALKCQDCGHTIPLQGGVPVFTPPPEGLQPSEKLLRGPNVGTPWRQANWRFLEGQITSLSKEALILDVGAGRGDFADLFQKLNYLALDVYPYPEVDIVCDLTQTNPFRDASFDVIVLMNVMEHVYDTHAMLARLAKMLKKQGALIVAIPFMVKMHQVPIDFVRYTHFALERLGRDHGLEMELLEGFYDPVFFLGEGIGNLKWSVLPTIRGARHYVGRVLLGSIQIINQALQRTIGPGQTQPPSQMRSLAPTGYQIVYRKS